MDLQIEISGIKVIKLKPVLRVLFSCARNIKVTDFEKECKTILLQTNSGKIIKDDDIEYAPEKLSKTFYIETKDTREADAVTKELKQIKPDINLEYYKTWRDRKMD